MMYSFPHQVLFSDIDQPATAVLKVFTQPRTARIIRGFSRHQEETCIGKEEFVVPVQSCEKQLRRISLPGTPECQALVIYGTYVSSSAQVLLDNKCIYSGFITVYIRGQFAPVSMIHAIYRHWITHCKRHIRNGNDFGQRYMAQHCFFMTLNTGR